MCPYNFPVSHNSLLISVILNIGLISLSAQRFLVFTKFLRRCRHWPHYWCRFVFIWCLVFVYIVCIKVYVYLRLALFWPAWSFGFLFILLRFYCLIGARWGALFHQVWIANTILKISGSRQERQRTVCCPSHPPTFGSLARCLTQHLTHAHSSISHIHLTYTLPSDTQYTSTLLYSYVSYDRFQGIWYISMTGSLVLYVWLWHWSYQTP